MPVLDTNHPCGYCGESESYALYPTIDANANRYHIHRCSRCSAFFLAPRPTGKDLQSAYDSRYYGVSDEKFGGLTEWILDFQKRCLARRLARRIDFRGRVLDIGCGNGKFLGFLAKEGIEIHGIEQSAEAGKRAAQISTLNLKIGALTDGDYQEGFFDAVVLWQVFEHLPNPKETLEIVSKILRPEGILLIAFPNIASLQGTLFKGKWFHLDPPRHLVFFRPEDFRKIMIGFGFALTHERHFHPEYDAFGALQSFLNMVVPQRDVLYETMKGNTEYVREIGKWSLLWQKVFFAFALPCFSLFGLVESLLKRGSNVEFLFTAKKER